MDALVAAEELEGGLAVEVPGAAALAGIAVDLREESCMRRLSVSICLVDVLKK